MQCPKCGYEQPDGAVECRRCGVVFAKLQSSMAGSLAESYPPPSYRATTAPPPPKEPSGWLKLSGLLAVGCGWLWFFVWAPPGLPVPANAYTDAEHGFAIVPPEGWQATPVSDCKNVGGPLAASQACVVLVLRRGVESAGPVIMVTTASVSSLFKTGWFGGIHLTQSDTARMATSFEGAVRETLPGFTSDLQAVAPVDRIPSLHVRGSVSFKGLPTMVGGKLVTIPSLHGPAPEYQATFGNVLVPAGRDAFWLAGMSETADYAYVGPAFEAAVASFRVTKGRPTAFKRYGGLMGSIIGDGILGGLVGLTLALLKLLR
jgi:hypothetical protein